MNSILPQESRVLRAIAALLADELDCSQRLLQFGAHLPNTKPDLHVGQLRHDTIVSAIGLYTKATTSFRAALHLCKIGCDRNAMPVTRSLFETTLNIAFLIRQRVTLYQFNDSKKKPRTPLNLFGKSLTTEFRTDLYNAWCILKDEKMVQGFGRTPGLKRAGNRLSKKLGTLDRPYVDQIGTDWEKWIKGKNTCAGLSIADFAASLGQTYRLWHGLVYALESQHVHQSDLVSFLDADPTSGIFSPRWFTSPDEVRSSLHKAATIYLGCIEELNRRFRFGEEAKRRIGEFGSQLRNWNLDASGTE